MRPQKPGLLGQVGKDGAFIPDVIATGENINIGGQELLGDLRGDAKAAGGVFHVGYAKVDSVRLNQSMKLVEKSSSPGLAEDISYEEYAHVGDPIPIRAIIIR
jgi:hypothetical protein